jgi:hypothetical protein
MSGRIVEELQRLRRIEQVCKQVENRWRNGERPAIESCLLSAEPDDRPELLAELLQLEWDYRRSRSEWFDVAEYGRRFASDSEVVSRVWEN